MNYYAYEDGKKVKVLGRTAFNKEVSAKNQFNVERPVVMTGGSFGKQADDISHINKRRGIGNNEILRENFLQAAIAPRQANSFSAIVVERPGNVLELGEKTLSRMFEVKVPDSTDFEWVREEARMRARLTPTIRRQNPTLTPDEVKAMVDSELKINKPLGREQRMKLEKKNIAQSNLSVEDKIKELSQEVSQGRALNTADKADILAQLALSFADVKADAATNYTLLGADIAQILKNTGAKTLTYTQVFGTTQARIVDYEFVKNNVGKLTILFYSWVEAQDNPNGIRYITYNKPIYDIKKPINAADLSQGFYINKMSFLAMLTDVSRTDEKARRYLDLLFRAMITPVQANYIANAMVADGEIKTPEEALDASIPQQFKDYILQDAQNLAQAVKMSGVGFDTALFSSRDTIPPPNYVNSPP
jgi:hypothetical protein